MSTPFAAAANYKPASRRRPALGGRHRRKGAAVADGGSLALTAFMGSGGGSRADDFYEVGWWRGAGGQLVGGFGWLAQPEGLCAWPAMAVVVVAASTRELPFADH